MLKTLVNEGMEKYVKAFIETYIGWYKKTNSRQLDVDDKELTLYFALNKAFNFDAQLRTLDKLVTGSDVCIDQEAKKPIVQWLVKEIHSWLHGETDLNFDEWHKQTCIEFLRRVNTELLKDKYYPMHYGKAQKIVNMTFKYLSTCDNADKYEERFLMCHMPVDKKILSWYNHEVCPELKKKPCRESWSNFDDERYFDIQKDIRAYLSKSGKYPLIEEWRIFAEYDK